MCLIFMQDEDRNLNRLLRYFVQKESHFVRQARRKMAAPDVDANADVLKLQQMLIAGIKQKLSKMDRPDVIHIVIDPERLGQEQGIIVTPVAGRTPRS